ncbi:amidohydrolase [Kocuria dechangensis]|uniref:Amidohydrolase n=1 Tax=Kocuria dechangensis TaxID=1176249 RepID=A0A917LXA2_9MICC|nr:amidohydrolase [Kocuria dechangensis]GGG61611.1 amidohydrolase [Kocuria dechangensis]
MVQVQELVIKNAVVRTVDARDSVHSAVLLRDGRIAAVGTEGEVRAAAARDAEIFDANGRTVVPGFIDAHNHMSIAAFDPVSVDCSTPPMTTMDEVLTAIEAHCKNLPTGQWARGFGFHMTKISEMRNPTRYELDEVAPHNPFFLSDASCHAGFANSAALEAVGISACTPEPWGGEIERDSKGVPTGVLLEAAMNLVQSASWEDYAERDWDTAVDLLEAKARDYLAVGLTGIGDACVTQKAAELYRRADASGRLPLTLQQLHGGDHFFAQQDLRRTDIVDRIHRADSHMLRSGTMKIFVDRAFPDGPAIHKLHDGCTQHVGTNFYNPREVHDLATQASGLGIDLAIHGMGNCAVDAVADAYETVRRRTGEDTILRLEHAFVAEPAQASRLAGLGIDLVANPGLAHTWGDVFTEWRGDDQKHLRVLPVRSMIDAGVRVSFASDHPCGIYSPAEIMWNAVARRHYTGAYIDPEEAVTAAEALRAYTINPAHASGRAHEEGSIEVGKRANILVLDRDPLTCPTDDLRFLTVDRTYVDGEMVYQRQEQNATV